MSDTLGDSSTPNAFRASRLAQPEPARAVWGLFNQKERWGLSLRGRLILTSTLLLAAAFLLKNVYPFLTTTHRVDAEVLVVEGWVHEFAIRAAMEEFRRGSYQRVLTTGGPVQGSGRYINDYQTAASVGADLLRKNGLPNECLQMVPSRVMDHDRTYGSAIALQNWFHQQNMAVSGINVVTEDLHARRTRLLFKKALGKNVAVGVIAVPNPDYDARHWWRYSDGVREVIGESIAYIYARFFFYPSVSSSNKTARTPLRHLTYDELKSELESADLKVDILQSQPALLKHLADVRGHRCLVSGDSLPMHCGVRCVSILPARVHGKYTGTACRKKLSHPFWKSSFISGATIDARPPQSALRK